MKKFVIYLSLCLSLFSIVRPAFAVSRDITDIYDIKITPIPYDKQNPDQSCPPQMDSIYAQLNETCASSYDDFLTDPIKKHYWIEDPAITAQGKSDERARQFLYWVLTTSAIDDAPVLRQIWNTVSLIAVFGVILIAAIFGIGYIISTRTNFDFKIRIWPTVIKLGVMLLYVVLSAAIVLLLIQLSEVIMKFFIDTLGGKDLFNIYFTTPTAASQTTLLGATERSYKEFIGARDLNIRVQEGIQAEMYLLKMTNVTYYVMGIMLLLRKILLWFLLFVSPFLALLMPFVLIRNTGWIWIGVFFQWLFYGPLLALFLGATSKIWREGIPFNFDFSRTTPPTAGFRPEGYVYPTGMNIVYGGPGQNGGFGRAINSGNNGNYIDTFAEYVITLLMLWAVTFFPWWLLRIFRDYCCEGIYAMRNILLAMYDQMRSTPPKGPTPGIPPKAPTSSLKQTTPTNTNINVSLSSLEAIRKTVSGDIARNLNLNAQKITDVAQLEINQQTRNTVIRNITYLSNPVKIQKPVERQQYMNLRSELFARAIKNDSIAKTILASTSTTTAEKVRIREEIIRSIPIQISISQVVVNSTNVPKDKVYTITNNYTKSIVNNEKTINNIAKSSNTTNQAVKNILNSYAQHTTESPTQVIQSIAKETNISPTTVKTVLSKNGAIGRYISEVHKTAVSENVSREKVTNIINSLKEMTANAGGTPPSGPSLVTKISNETSVPASSVQKILSDSYESVTTNNETIQQIAQDVNVPAPQVKAVITAFVAGSGNSPQTTITNIAQNEHLDKQTVSNILQKTSTIAQTISGDKLATELHVEPQKLPQILQIAGEETSRPEVLAPSAPEIRVMNVASISERIAKDTNLKESSTKEILDKTFSTVLSHETTIQEIATKTTTQPATVKNVIQSYAATIENAPQSVIRDIAQKENLSTSQVTQILTESMQNVTTNDANTLEIANQTNMSQDQVNTVIKTASEEIHQTAGDINTYPSILEHITNETHLPQNAIQQTVMSSYESVVNSQASIAQIAEKVHSSPEKVKETIQSFASNINNDSQTVLQTIAKQEQISTSVVSQIIEEATTVSTSQPPSPRLVEEIKVQPPQIHQILTLVGKEAQPAPITVTASPTEPVVKVVSYKSNISENTSRNIISNIMNQAVKNETIISQVQQETQLQPQQIKNVINTFAENVAQPAPVIIDRISETSGIPKDKVQSVVNTTADTILSAEKVVTDVAEKEGVKEEDVVNTINTQMDLAAKPDENIEKVIPIPQSVSIEDYEQVKEMWTKHYEEGEIPVSETIQSRSDWIEQEIVYIANTLNKILSSDEELRQEGLDELGFLLPIFLINNLKGEELVVYLKAKLEAAKQTQKLLAKEEEVKSKYEKKKAEEEDEEELVEVNNTKEEAAPQEMTMSFDEDQENPQSIEDRENAVREKLENMESEDETSEPSIDDIKSKLQAQGETEKTDVN